MMNLNEITLIVKKVQKNYLNYIEENGLLNDEMPQAISKNEINSICKDCLEANPDDEIGILIFIDKTFRNHFKINPLKSDKLYEIMAKVFKKKPSDFYHHILKIINNLIKSKKELSTDDVEVIANNFFLSVNKSSLKKNLTHIFIQGNLIRLKFYLEEILRRGVFRYLKKKKRRLDNEIPIQAEEHESVDGIRQKKISVEGIIITKDIVKSTFKLILRALLSKKEKCFQVYFDLKKIKLKKIETVIQELSSSYYKPLLNLSKKEIITAVERCFDEKLDSLNLEYFINVNESILEFEIEYLIFYKELYSFLLHFFLKNLTKSSKDNQTDIFILEGLLDFLKDEENDYFKTLTKNCDEALNIFEKCNSKIIKDSFPSINLLINESKKFFLKNIWLQVGKTLSTHLSTACIYIYMNIALFLILITNEMKKDNLSWDSLAYIENEETDDGIIDFFSEIQKIIDIFDCKKIYQQIQNNTFWNNEEAFFNFFSKVMKLHNQHCKIKHGQLGLTITKYSITPQDEIYHFISNNSLSNESLDALFSTESPLSSKPGSLWDVFNHKKTKLTEKNISELMGVSYEQYKKQIQRTKKFLKKYILNLKQNKKYSETSPTNIALKVIEEI